MSASNPVMTFRAAEYSERYFYWVVWVKIALKAGLSKIVDLAAVFPVFMNLLSMPRNVTWSQYRDPRQVSKKDIILNVPSIDAYSCKLFILSSLKRENDLQTWAGDGSGDYLETTVVLWEQAIFGAYSSRRYVPGQLRTSMQKNGVEVATTLLPYDVIYPLDLSWLWFNIYEINRKFLLVPNIPAAIPEIEGSAAFAVYGSPE